MTNKGTKGPAGTARAAARSPEHWGGRPDPEVNSMTPVEIPFDACIPTPLHEIVARLVRQQVEQEQSQEFETLEESDDFTLTDPEDILPTSGFELTQLQEDEEFETPPEPEAPASDAPQEPETPPEVPPDPNSGDDGA